MKSSEPPPPATESVTGGATDPAAAAAGGPVRGRATGEQAEEAAAPLVPLIRNGSFQALWISRLFASMGKEAAEVAYPLLILATTGSATYAGTVGAVQLLVAGVVSIWGGSLADRLDRRTLLIVCDVGRAVLLAVFGLLILSGQPGVPVILAVVACSAALLGASEPPALAAIKQLVPPEQLTRATAQNQIRPLGATVIGSPVGGSLFAIGRAVPFLATALMFASSAVSLLFIRRPMQAHTADRRERQGAAEGFRFIFREPVLLIWIIWIMGSNMALNHTGAFLALIATAKERGASEPAIGLMLGVAGAGSLVGAALASLALRKLRPSVIFLYAAWVGPLAAVLLATVPGVLSLGVILACVFLRGPIVNALFFAYVAALVPDRLQGRVIGAVTFLSYIAQPIGIFGVGAVFDLGGPQWVFAAVCAVSTLAALPTLTRRIRTLPAPDELTARDQTREAR